VSQPDTPTALDLKKDRGLTIQWGDGTGSYYSIPYLRRMSPSADQRELRKHMAKNPLTVLPASSGTDGGAGGPLVATDAEMVGNYAIRISFSDGHSSGIYTWAYLREIAPATHPEGEDRAHAPGDDAPPHDRPLGL
jgi:DUF971 family protein